MHIITGILISTLLSGRKKRQPHALTHSQWPVKTVHQLPGRVRFRVPLMVGRKQRLEDAVGRLGQIEGVVQATGNSVTGSVVVHFNPGQLSADLLCAALIRLLGLDNELQRTPPSRLGTGFRGLGRTMDLAMHEHTRGLIDFRTLVPLSLGAIGVYRLMVERPVSLPNAITMVWWSYTSLTRAHHP